MFKVGGGGHRVFSGTVCAACALICACTGGQSSELVQSRARGLTVSEEIALGSARLAEAPVPVHAPALAAGGEGYLAVWYDGRAFLSVDKVVFGGDLFAAWIGSDGKLGPSFGVSHAPGPQVLPALAFDGTNFMAVWTDDRVSYGNDTTISSSIYGARISRQNGLLDPQGFRLSDGEGSDPALAFDGSNYLATFVRWDDNQNSDVLAVRFRPDGTRVDAAPTVVASGPLRQETPAVAYNGDQYLVVWQEEVGEDGNLRAARVGRDGRVVDTTPITVSAVAGTESEPAVASNGTDWLAVWHGVPSGWNAARIAANGTRLDTPPLDLGEASQWMSIGVAWDGTAYRVAHSEVDDQARYVPCYVRVTASGSVLDHGNCDAANSSENGGDVQLASNAGATFALWQENTSPPGQATRGGLLDSNARPSGPVGLVQSSTPQHSAVAAFAADTFLVAWIEPLNVESQQLVVARVDRSGQLDAEPVHVAGGAVANPALTAAGDGFLLAWENTNTKHLVVASIGSDGRPRSVVSPAGEAAATLPALAFDGSRYLLAWEDASFSGGIRALFLASDGQAASRTFSIAPTAARAPVVSAACGSLLVAWNDERDGPSEPYVRVASITSDRDLADGEGTSLGRSWIWDHRVSVASNGELFFVTWLDRVREQVLGARVTLDGTVLDPSGKTIFDEYGWKAMPRATWDGSRFLVTWLARPEPDAHPDVLGTHVDPAGAFDAAAPTLLSRTDPGASSIALTSDRRGTSLLTYHRLVLDPELLTARVRARTIAGQGASSVPFACGAPDAGLDAAGGNSGSAGSGGGGTTDAGGGSSGSGGSAASNGLGNPEHRAAEEGGGCGCRTTPSSPLNPLLTSALLGLVAAARRRKRHWAPSSAGVLPGATR
jgi:MYXO-CTERM domain-containing protein